MGQGSTLLSEAKNSLSAGQWDQAIGQLESLKEKDSSAEVFENLARAFALRGRYLSVLSVYLEWARCELERGDFERAEAALSYAEALSPGTLEVHRVKLEITRARGDLGLLVSRLQGLAMLALEQGEGDSSVGYLREAMEAAPENLDLRVQLAELMVSLGQIPAAVKEYRRAVESFREAGQVEACLRPLRGLKLLSSDDAELLLELGDTCLELDRIDEAEEQFRAVLKLDLENRRALLKLGQVCYRKGLFRNGILALSKVLQLDPDCAEGHKLMGDTMAVSADLEAALEKYQRAALLYLEQGDSEKAATVYRSVLKFDSENAEALHGLVSLGFDPEALQSELSPAPVEMPTAAAVSATTEMPEEPPSQGLLENVEETGESKRFVRPALVKKSEFADSESSSASEQKSIRPGLMIRGDAGAGKFSLKQKFVKPLFPQGKNNVSTSETESTALAQDPVEVIVEEHGNADQTEELEFSLLDELFNFESPKPETEPVAVEPEVPEQPEEQLEVRFEDLTEAPLEEQPVAEEEFAVAEEPRSIELLEVSDIFEDWDLLDDCVEIEPVKFELELELPESAGGRDRQSEQPDIVEVSRPEDELDFDDILAPLQEPEEPNEPERVDPPLSFDIPLPSVEPVDAQRVEEEFEVADDLLELLSLTLPSEPLLVEVSESAEVPIEPAETQVEVPAAEAVPEENFEAEETTLDDLRRHLQLRPTDEAALLSLGDMCLKFGLIEEALGHYRSLEAVNPGSVESISRVIKAALWLEDHETVSEGLWKAANIYWRQGALGECQDSLGSLLALRPNHKPAREMMVEVFLVAGQEKLAAWHLSQMAERWMMEREYDDAVTALERLVSLSSDLGAKEQLAKLYDFQGRLDQARTLYRELRALHEEEDRLDRALEVAELIVATSGYSCEDAERLLSLYQRLGMSEKVLAEKRRFAEGLRDRGEPRRAVELLQDVLAANPSDLGTERLLVELYLESGELQLAEAHADSLAERFLREKAYPEGVELFEFWSRTVPTSARVRERLAQFYQLSGDLDGAKFEWILVAEAHQISEDYERACRALERALELAPSEREWRLQLARLKIERLDDTKGALAELRHLFALDPAGASANAVYLELLWRGRDFEELSEALAKLNEFPEGAVSTQRILQHMIQEVEGRPDDLELQYGLGRIYLSRGSLDRAIELFQKLRRSRNYELRAYHQLGLCFARKNGFNMRELALSQFRKGLALSGQDPDELYRLRYDVGCLLQEMNRVEEAREQFRQCPADFRDVAVRLSRLTE